MRPLKYIDLFCGIGGFRIAMERASTMAGYDSQCVFSSDIDPHCQHAYAENFDHTPESDITAVDASQIPGHDMLLAGFPCQAFSIIGKRQGFNDARGTLFFDIARILDARRPKMLVLENVKQLVGHNNGQTMETIVRILGDLGYSVRYKVLNALDFGLPQKRERVWIVGSTTDLGNFEFPKGGGPYVPLDQILEKDVPETFYASPYIQEKRRNAAVRPEFTSIWHENKSGNISVLPYSCALRSGASYNYLLVNGERRLTPREMLRLQGFPDSYKIVVSDSQVRRQAGNSLPVNVAEQVIHTLLRCVGQEHAASPTKNSREISSSLPFEPISAERAA